MTDTKAPSKQNLQPDVQTGLEELLEDFFGLNIRSFRTLKTLFTKPNLYFQAAQSSDWSDRRYTPSPRLWLGLIALVVALRIFWGGENSPFITNFAELARESFEQGAPLNSDGLQTPKIDWIATVNKMFDLTFILQPILLVLMFAVLAIFMRFWGQQLTYVTRLRYLFAIILPATVFSVLTYLILPFTSPSLYIVISILQMIVLTGYYFWTCYAGGFHALEKGSRIWRSIGATILILIAVMLAAFIAQTLAMVLVLYPEINSAV